ncbi:MAG: restriction endonuclease [candidate division Zixibacteria bacterium RBG_16_50_21]|nr:MAG: restriction endonuclease [candidate division Zixibacteria bacterium RBG_16_50_21]
MKLWIGVTDNDWFEVVSHIPNIDEVNFWQPGGRASTFKILQPGEPFLFKLHSPLNFIVGGGFFAHWTRLPISLAWEAFGEKNGAHSFEEMRNLIISHRGTDKDRFDDFHIGCILLEQPFFFNRSDWIPVPSDWKAGIRQGKHYDLQTDPGKSLWEQVRARIGGKPDYLPETRIEDTARYGTPTLVKPRLGQGSFRILVTDAYGRACAITEEHTLPALEAAHIKPFNLEGPNAVYNGLLLRSDVHRLFDKGYITVTPDLRIEVSRRIRDEFENGRYYYPFHGHRLHHLPLNSVDHPSKALLNWHNEYIFRE